MKIPPWKYHVFLSFRGEDTRKGFTDHLHAALKQKGIITFKDDKLERGEVISHQLLQAIDESLISLIIISETFASSSWCLDELQRILESKKSLDREVLPIFYKIDPSDVRHQKGTFTCAFQKHSQRFAENKEKVQRWRDALVEVSNISGYHSTDQHEAKLIEKITAEVWAKVQPKLPYCFNNELIDIESRVEEVGALLKIGICDVRFIGIWGMTEMGRSIVLEESPNDASKRSRIWSLEDIDHVLTKSKGSDLIEVIHLQTSAPYEENWDFEAFSNMCSLRILIISCNVYLPYGLSHLPSSLKMLEWESYPLQYLPLGVHLYQLVLLKMHHSKIIGLWEKTQMFEKLKCIDLRYSEDFIRTPDFSMIPNLENLVLEGCVKLVEVHASLGEHKKLVVLNFKDCKNLKTLPRRMKMDSLEKLVLSGCLKVKKLPEFGKSMNRLLVLDVKNCKNLVCLPSSTCNLKSLKILNIFGCPKFSSLPQNIGENKCLEELDLSGTTIRDIPSSIIDLQNLKSLYLKGCNGVTSTSNSLWNLLSRVSRVFGFVIDEAPTGLVFPHLISSLASLKELDISDCKFKTIPDSLECLPSLQVLDLSSNDFGNLHNSSCILPPSFSRLSSLKSLKLINCNLYDGSIPEDLSFLSSLRTLDLIGNNFTHLPAQCVANLSLLSHLHLSYCPKLKYLPDLPPNLGCMETVGCHSLQHMSFLEFVSALDKSSLDFTVSYPPGILNYMAYKCRWRLESDIPKWFHNENVQFLDKVVGFPRKHVQISERKISCLGYEQNHCISVDGLVPSNSIVSIKVDISHLRGSSVRWGISLCIVLQDLDLPLSKDVFHRYCKVTCKASQDEFFTKKVPWRVDMGNNPHQMLMIYFPRSNFNVHCDQIEFIFYTVKCKCIDMEAQCEGKVDLQNESKFVISKCGWRVISEEDVEECRRSMNECSISGNSEILSQRPLYAYGKRSHQVEEVAKEDNIVANDEVETFSAKRRKL